MQYRTDNLNILYVADEWTALEIAIFEEAFEKFDRKFHLIADQVRFPKQVLMKSCRVSIERSNLIVYCCVCWRIAAK